MKPIHCGLISSKSEIYHNFRWDLVNPYIRVCEVSYMYILADSLEEFV